MPSAPTFDQTLRREFDRQGYFVIERYLSEADCQRLRAQALSLAAGYELSDGAAVFSTRTHAHGAQRYFLDSARDVRCFLEEDARDANGDLRQPLRQCINKIGHALHDLDPVFGPFSHSDSVRDLAEAMGLVEPKPIQSMVIFKQPRIGGEVVWHQDATFLYTDPVSVVGFWFALEAATVENGCLQVLPGRHRDGLKRRFIRVDDQTRFETLDSSRWDLSEAVSLEVPEGALVGLHGLLPHASAPNSGPASRLAYSLHLIDGQCHYPADNWLQ